MADKIAKSQRRFWSKVDKRGQKDCWEWRGYRDDKGYGRYHYLGRQMGAHRVAWILTNGDNIRDLVICHKCDNPPCCNPSHLFRGTQEDNLNDMVAKGRHRFGGR